jgi:hypothetical protein
MVLLHGRQVGPTRIVCHQAYFRGECKELRQVEALYFMNGQHSNPAGTRSPDLLMTQTANINEEVFDCCPASQQPNKFPAHEEIVAVTGSTLPKRLLSTLASQVDPKTIVAFIVC